MAFQIWFSSKRAYTLDEVLDYLGAQPFIEPEGLEAEYLNPATGVCFVFEYLGRYVDEQPPPESEFSRLALADRFSLLASLPVAAPSHTLLEALPLLQAVARDLDLGVYLEERHEEGEQILNPSLLEAVWLEKSLQELGIHMAAGKSFPHRPDEVVDGVWKWNSAVGAGVSGAAPIAFLAGGEEPATTTIWNPGRAGLLPEVETLLLTMQPEAPLPTRPAAGYAAVPWREIAPLLADLPRQEQPWPHYEIQGKSPGGLLQRLTGGWGHERRPNLNHELEKLARARPAGPDHLVNCLSPDQVLNSSLLVKARRESTASAAPPPNDPGTA